MSPRRLALLALLAIALAPGLARAAIPVGMYPFRVPGLSPQQRTELHSVLEAALVSASRRGILQPRAPLLQLANCGDTPVPACLGIAARDGLLLVGRGEIKGSVLLVTAALYDRNGARTREARFVVDLVIQNLRPIGDALMELEIEIDPDGTVAGSKKALPPERDPFGQKPVASGAPPPKPAAPPPLPARPAAPAPAPRAKLDVSAPAAPAVWKRQAGPLFTVLGGALLAGGAAVAVVNRNLAADLDAKRSAGRLTAADRASYDKVDRYNVLSTVLLSAGGVSAAAGTWIWITAPARPGGGAVAMAGGTF
jgi:hypothetical protein